MDVEDWFSWLDVMLAVASPCFLAKILDQPMTALHGSYLSLMKENSPLNFFLLETKHFHVVMSFLCRTLGVVWVPGKIHLIFICQQCNRSLNEHLQFWFRDGVYFGDHYVVALIDGVHY